MKEIDKLNYRPFTRFCMSIGAVPTSYLAGLTIEEQLLWLCSYLEKEVIPAVNNNGEAVEELQNLYVELKSYVDTYFDNLDVQEEINNKLDDMAEQGTLQEIVAKYLNSKAIFGFDTISDLKSATNLINGSYARTLGYYAKNDNGGSLFKIRTVTNDDVIDEGSIVSLYNDDLIAELIVENDYININQFGAKGNDSTINDSYILNALNYCVNHNVNKILFDVGTYKINNSIVLNNNHSYLEIAGINCQKSLIKSDNEIIYIDIQSGTKQYIHDLGFYGAGHMRGQTGIGKSSPDNVIVARQKFEHLYFYGLTYGVNIRSGYFDSPIMYDFYFQTVQHCIKLKHCEGGTIQKMVAEPFVYTFAELFQCSSCEIRDGLINGAPNINNTDNCAFLIMGGKIDNKYISGCNVKISNIHSEQIHQFALVLQPNTYFEDIYIWNSIEGFVQSRNTFDFGCAGGVHADSCSIKNLVYWSREEKPQGISDFHTRTLSELKYTIPGTNRVLNLSIGSIEDLKVTNAIPTEHPFIIDIPFSPAAGVHNDYSIQSNRYTMKNGNIIYDNFSNSVGDIPSVPDSLYGFNRTQWNYNDKVTHLGLYWFTRSSQNSWFRYANTASA